MKFDVQLYGPLNNMQGEVLEKLAALSATSTAGRKWTYTRSR